MARQSGSPIDRVTRKSVVDGTAGSGDSTITADCGRGQCCRSADNEAEYITMECSRDDGRMTAGRTVNMGSRRTQMLHT
eukprot:scaffold99548_cov63-Attheya_sp.AAC.2